MAYAQIIELVVPAKAQPGTTVTVTVRVRNTYDSALNITMTGLAGTKELHFGGYYYNIPAGGEQVFTDTFTMPSSNVNVIAESWWLWGTQWQRDDRAEATVEVEAEAPAASIVAKLLEYSGLSVSLPAGNVPQGASAKLRVRVRNDMSTSQTLGISWVIVDPQGSTVHSYSDWETWTTSPGSTHDFVSPSSFLLSKVGEYRVGIAVYISPSTTPVDSFQGTLCTTVLQEIPTGLMLTSIDTVYGTYDPLATVPYVLRYQYQGKAQSGTLQIELGTGVAPWFTPEVALDPVPYSFAKKDALDWVTENRSFRIPDTVRRGQTYSARVTLRTADGLTDNDIDYTALKVSDPAVPTTDLRDIDFTITYGEYDLGDPLVIRLSYRYQGVAQSGQASVLIGKGAIFSPVYTYAPKPVSFAHADALTTRTEDIEVTLPMTLEPGQVYSVKVVLETSDGETDDKTKGSQFKIDSDAVPEDPGVGQYRVVKDYAYPAAETYVGQASEVTYEFNVPMAQLEVIGDWLSRKVIDEHENEVKKHGSQMLHLKVSERERGLTSKDYLVVATATVPEETAGQEYTPQGIVSLVYVTPMLAPVVWAAIILGVLGIIFTIALAFLIKESRTFLWGEDGVPPEGWGETVGMMAVMGLMVAVMTARPKATEWVETGTTKLVKKGRAKIEEKVR